MKYSASIVLLAGSALAASNSKKPVVNSKNFVSSGSPDFQGFSFRDMSMQKKNGKFSERALSSAEYCGINHDAAQSVAEIEVGIQGYTVNGDSYLDITVCDEPYAPADKCVAYNGWCLDYDRPIDATTYKMDVFSAFDPDLHYHGTDKRFNAVDKRERLPNIAWLINNRVIGYKVPKENCPALSGTQRTLTWREIQKAMWYVIDDNVGEPDHIAKAQDCVARQVAADAIAQGVGYVPDCNDPFELVPLVFVVDDDETGEITNQVIISVVNIALIEGMCYCNVPKDCDDIPAFEETYKDLPAKTFSGNPNCQDLGYDFGYKIEGCVNGFMEYDSLIATKGGCADGANLDVGSVTITCLKDGGSEYIDAEIKPSVDSVVIMKGGTGGVIYSGLDAGGSYTVDVGQRKGISHIEFCFRCEGPCTEAPTSTPETPVPTIAPTLPPVTGNPAPPKETPVPTIAPTKEPVVDTIPPEPTDPPAPDQPTADREGPTKPPGVKGDPHFKTFAGELYDFHGECDLVLLHNPLFKDGLGMDIHIRTKIEDFWSSVETSALKIGESTIEVAANPESDEWLWINGELVTGLDADKWVTTKFEGMILRYKETSPFVREITLYLEGHGEKLVMKTFKSFVRVDVPFEGSNNFVGSSGLLGTYDANGERLGRDGATFLKDTHVFGKEWQVNESEPQIFHSYEGAVVVGQECVMPPAWDSERGALIKRRLAESALTQEDAEKACEHLSDPEELESCVFDVLATQDLEMASVW